MMKNFVLIFFSALLFWGCEETDLLDETGRLEVTDINLPVLPDGYHYQAWLLVGGSYVSVGSITNDSIINNRARFSKIDANDLKAAQSFAITVEINNTLAPSDYVLLVGDFNGNISELNSNAETSNGIKSLGNKISASFSIQNATVPGDLQNNYGENGVWFFHGEGENKQTTLNLSYKGISYQAWLKAEYEGTNRYLNMGKIHSDTLADDWNRFAINPENTPPFPGEDFLTAFEGGDSFPIGFFPYDVKGSTLIITPIHNNYTNSSVPFPVHLLEATIPMDATRNPYVTYPMQINTNFSARATKL